MPEAWRAGSEMGKQLVAGVKELEGAVTGACVGIVQCECGVRLGSNPDFASYVLSDFRPVTWRL